MQKKAQFTIEFILIFAMAFLIFLILLVFVTRYVDFANTETEKEKLGTLAENIKKNIVLAHQSGQGFEVEVVIPSEYDDEKINISADHDMLYIKSVSSNFIVTRQIPAVGGNFKIGCNKIKKEGGLIEITDC